MLLITIFLFNRILLRANNYLFIIFLRIFSGSRLRALGRICRELGRYLIIKLNRNKNYNYFIYLGINYLLIIRDLKPL